MNERTHFFIKIYLSHFILERVDVGCVWEGSWRRGQTATYWPKVLLTIAALLSHSGWAAQPWVTEGPTPSACRWLSIRHLVPNWLQLQRTQAVCGTWLCNCLTCTCFLWAYAFATITEFNHAHRSRWYPDIFDRMHLFRCSSAYLHRYISWLTARSRANMLHHLQLCVVPIEKGTFWSLSTTVANLTYFIKLGTIVEGNLKVPFSIATTSIDDYYQIRIFTWRHIIVYKLLVWNRNTWNYITVCK